MFSHARPTLSIMDGIVGMEGDGPAAGRLRDIGLIIASGDAVALDAVFADIVGLDPLKIPLIREAHERNLGVADLKRIDVAGEKAHDARIKNFKMPKTLFYYKLPGFIFKAGMSQVNFYPHIDKKKCKRCGLCLIFAPRRL